MPNMLFFSRKLTKDLKRFVMTQMKKNRLNMKKDSQLCEKISEKYLPFGLETTIPQNLLEFCKDLTGMNNLFNRFERN